MITREGFLCQLIMNRLTTEAVLAANASVLDQGSTARKPMYAFMF